MQCPPTSPGLNPKVVAHCIEIGIGEVDGAEVGATIEHGTHVGDLIGLQVCQALNLCNLIEVHEPCVGRGWRSGKVVVDIDIPNSRCDGRCCCPLGLAVACIEDIVARPHIQHRHAVVCLLGGTLGIGDADGDVVGFVATERRVGIEEEEGLFAVLFSTVDNLGPIVGQRFLCARNLIGNVWRQVAEVVARELIGDLVEHSLAGRLVGYLGVEDVDVEGT